MKLISSTLLGQASLVLALLAPGHVAEAGSVLNLCNVGNTTLFVVTIGQTPPGGWAIDGWRIIDVSECQSVKISFHSMIGFAVAEASGRKGMQVYDRALFPSPSLRPTEWRYCVDPEKDFHREHNVLKGLSVCEAGEVLARFAFHVKPSEGEVLTLRIPADENGDVFPLLEPASFVPDASLVTAMRGLAEQQERLGFKMEQRDLLPITSWPAYYVRELGVVVRSETHAVSVAKGSPADRAGIHRRDEIVQIDDIKLKSAWHARSLLVRMRPGETHAISFLHGGELHKKEISLEALPADLASTDLHPRRGWLGIEFESSARVVAVIYQDGASDLELDDDIQKIGRVDFDGVDGLAQWLARDRGAPKVELQVWRASTGRIFVMSLDKLK